MAIVVSIVDDNPELRRSLAASLNNSTSVRCEKCYAGSEDALREIPLAPPDIVLMDINLRGGDGIQCVSKLKAQLPQLRVLMLTRFEQTELVFDFICAGAGGYLVKNTPSAELIEAIEQAQAGACSISMPIARKALHYFQLAGSHHRETEQLTPREKEILALMAGGESREEVCAACDAGDGDLPAQLRSIYRKIHLISTQRKQDL
jgi:DNA-binding NarL/FixJ family response regulator